MESWGWKTLAKWSAKVLAISSSDFAQDEFSRRRGSLGVLFERIRLVAVHRDLSVVVSLSVKFLKFSL